MSNEEKKPVKVRLLFAQVIEASPMGLTTSVRVVSDSGEDQARFDFQTIDGELYQSTGEVWADLSEVQELEAELRKMRGDGSSRILHSEDHNR